MSVTDPAHPLVQPADLWILPVPRKSAWFSVIDWYLNWQMCRALGHVGFQLPHETKSLAEEFDIEIPEAIKTSGLPLMVITGGRVPSPKCLVLDVADDRKWLEAGADYARELNAGRVRVFLPESFSRENARKAWPKEFKGQIEFTTDQEALS